MVLLIQDNLREPVSETNGHINPTIITIIITFTPAILDVVPVWLLGLSHCVTIKWLAAATQMTARLSQCTPGFYVDALPATTVSYFRA